MVLNLIKCLANAVEGQLHCTEEADGRNTATRDGIKVMESY